MKNFIITSFIIIMSSQLFSQNINGSWEGVLEVPGGKLRIVFNIEKESNAYTATMDSPDQGAFGIAASSVSFSENNLNISVANGAIVYDGIMESDNTIKGSFKQSGYSFELNLKKSDSKPNRNNRPQKPVKPYSYNSEDVSFYNEKANIKLSGTLTFPKESKKHPAVILISGSGPQDRDETIMGHKPFLVIADYLSRQGYAVLRYDDRGTAKSEGNFQTATSYDFSLDAEAALEFLSKRKEIDPSRIYLIGHSEGAIIASMIAARNKKVDAIVLLAGPGVSGDKILLSQQRLLAEQAGVEKYKIDEAIKLNKELYSIVKNNEEQNLLKNKLTEYLNKALEKSPELFETGSLSNKQFIESTVAQLSSNWFRYYIKLNPSTYLSELNCHVLALNGSKDLQVEADENLQSIKSSAEKGGNKKVRVKKLEGLNHLFQECNTGAVSEYGEIEQTFSPVALKEISLWLEEINN